MSLLIAALAAMIVQDPAAVRLCSDDRGVDRCAEESQTTTRQLLGLQPIETEAEADAEVYRALFVDGAGNDMPSVAFVRRPGSGPLVEVNWTGGQKMTADVPAETWNSVRELASVADRELLPRTSEELAEICLHAWVVTFEAAIPRQFASGEPKVRTRTENSCREGATVRFAFEAAGAALPLFPPCHALALGYSDIPILNLERCFALNGDRQAAAEVLRRFEDPPRFEGATRKDWRDLLGIDPWTRLTWNGEVVPPNPGGRDAGGATDFLMAKAADSGAFNFMITEAEGLNSQEVTTSGEAWIGMQNTVGEYVTHTAPMTQTWRLRGGEWRIVEWTIGSFAPALPEQ